MVSKIKKPKDPFGKRIKELEKGIKKMGKVSKPKKIKPAV
jgi:hypothetical protein